MKNLLKVFLTLTFVIAFSFGKAHGDEHDEESKQKTDSAQITTTDKTTSDEDLHEETLVTDSFVTYHPLVVHFPIVLLIVVAFIQLFNLYFRKTELSWLVLVLTLAGFIGAYLSSSYFHPHTHDLNATSKEILTLHETWARYTQWSSCAAFLLVVVNFFFLKRKFWMEMVVAMLLITSATFVSLAAHHGAMLVHQQGVGPQGKFIHQHHH